MAMVSDESLLALLQACADAAPLYPARYASEKNLDRSQLDEGLDELRRRGLVKLTDWVKELGQGRALTDAGTQALASRRLIVAAPEPAATVKSGPMDAYERGELARDAIFGTSRSYVPWILIGFNLAFFLAGAYMAWQRDFSVVDYLAGRGDVTGDMLFRLGDLRRNSIFPPFQPMRPQLERLIFFFFLHVGVVHLAMNMIFLATLGPLIEAIWGWLRFLAIYMISGFVSGCVILSLNMLQERNTSAAGASGALCGVFASMIVWFYLNREHLPENLLQDWARTLALNTCLLIATSLMPGVSWQGHLGGALGGLLAGLLMYVQRFHPSFAVRVLALLAMPFIPAAFFATAYFQAYGF
jgi:membrane associated rhomboid family serine protease